MSAPALRVLVPGAGGQVGRALVATVPDGFEVLTLGHAELDIADEAQVRQCVADYRPDLIINAAAYTAVDKAESDAAAANSGNVLGPRNLARVARDTASVRLLHISTDFVFDGSASAPYKTSDAVSPLSTYGKTKLEGERAALDTLPGRVTVVRTAWVYSACGRNFMVKMLRLLRQQGRVRVVDDQFGTPTAAGSLAKALWAFARRPDLSGVFHWTDAGAASWYDFAVAIAEEAHAHGLLTAESTVEPIASEEYPTAARRPAFSVLDKRSTVAALGLAPEHWRCALRSVMKELSVA